MSLEDGNRPPDPRPRRAGHRTAPAPAPLAAAPRKPLASIGRNVDRDYDEHGRKRKKAT